LLPESKVNGNYISGDDLGHCNHTSEAPHAAIENGFENGNL
jgi:hypothetical protein